MTLTVLAWDPGSERSAFARLRWDGRPRAVFEDGGLVSFGVPHIDADGIRANASTGGAQQVMLDGNPLQPNAPFDIAVELAEGHAFAAYRVPGLLGARGAGDALMLLAHTLVGRTAWAVPAPTWRGDLVRSKSPTDAQIAVAVRGLVDGLPKLAKKSGAHIYDACGLALYVLRRLGAKLTLTPEVEAELYRQTRADRGKANAKRARTKAHGRPSAGDLFARGAR